MKNLCFVSFWRNGSEKGCVINIFVPLNQEIQVTEHIGISVILDLNSPKLFLMKCNLRFWEEKVMVRQTILKKKKRKQVTFW